ncbi:EscU/YscU/HrcU family type III secretion system export apparatus switch protein [Vibrio aquaticus]|uniref:Flagellar biosynthetic protein FlhB n=1 Tax=Vibrio aquaticus TaxID=2496559 RepID=A0A3S0N6C6_9VIBR|nr:EscU/YscU/HrcU family type III secretion system export apparatus switch protein [Vibrio aquaticus]RTZ16654.1 EscU/YscU/HrcU family type III secretion system export apparatus switch protein [Vibrio aquaticus]
MSDDSSEPKVFPPSAKKLLDLKKKGQIPKSELVEPTLDVVGFCLITTYFLYFIFDNWNYIFESVLSDNVANVTTMLMEGLYSVSFVLLFLKIVLSVINWTAIKKGIFSTSEIKFKIEKVNPVNGFKNNYGPDGIARSSKKLVEALMLLFILKYIFDVIGTEELDRLSNINNKTYYIYQLLSYIIGLCVIFFIYGTVVGIVDFTFEDFQFKKKNRMTFTELKNEMKDTEGNPEVKSERKRLMKDIMQEPMSKSRKPTFALANPTHILIPISYDWATGKTPYVLNISTDSLAQHEKQKLIDRDIPVIEHVPLTRAIYKSMKTGNAEIPQEFYKQIAFILDALERYQNENK